MPGAFRDSGLTGLGFIRISGVSGFWGFRVRVF